MTISFLLSTNNNLVMTLGTVHVYMALNPYKQKWRLPILSELTPMIFLYGVNSLWLEGLHLLQFPLLSCSRIYHILLFDALRFISL